MDGLRWLQLALGAGEHGNQSTNVAGLEDGWRQGLRDSGLAQEALKTVPQIVLHWMYVPTNTLLVRRVSTLHNVLMHRVIAFEPVPHFRAFLEYNVDVNGLRHIVDVRPSVVRVGQCAAWLCEQTPHLQEWMEPCLQ